MKNREVFAKGRTFPLSNRMVPGRGAGHIPGIFHEIFMLSSTMMAPQQAALLL